MAQLFSIHPDKPVRHSRSPLAAEITRTPAKPRVLRRSGVQARTADTIGPGFPAFWQAMPGTLIDGNLPAWRPESLRSIPSAFIHETAVVIGEVIIGPNVSVWPFTTLRGDNESDHAGPGQQRAGGPAHCTPIRAFL